MLNERICLKDPRLVPESSRSRFFHCRPIRLAHPGAPDAIDSWSDSGVAAMGIVSLAEDREKGRRLALKTVTVPRAERPPCAVTRDRRAVEASASRKGADRKERQGKVVCRGCDGRFAAAEATTPQVLAITPSRQTTSKPRHEAKRLGPSGSRSLHAPRTPRQSSEFSSLRLTPWLRKSDTLHLLAEALTADPEALGRARAVAARKPEMQLHQFLLSVC